MNAMTRRQFLAALGAGAATALLPRAMQVQAAQPASRPNIIFMLADDLGWTDLGCYGSKFYETPNIDRLAREGMRFTQAYTAGAVCSPTRGSIMTGKYPVRTGVTDYIPGLFPSDAKLITPRTKMQLALEETTIGEALREEGYQTFYSGKWHLGVKGFEPGDQGFEVVVDRTALGDIGTNPLVGDRITESALGFLESRDKARPFFMFLGYNEPHTPILEHPRHIAHFKQKAAKLAKPERAAEPEHNGQSRLAQDDPGYAGEVAVLDDGVMRLREKLAALDLAGQTIFIFFSDNGGLCTKAQPGPTSNLPLRSGKGWLYEGGIRAPLIVRVPGVTKAGAVCEKPVISTDFFPTLLELAGLAPQPDKHVDGLSFVPLLRGQALPGRTFYWHYPHYHGSTWAPGGAMREGEWKLIEFFEDGTLELYNLAEDPGERNNLAPIMMEKAREIQGRLAAWRRETGAAMPKVNTNPTPQTQSSGKKKGKKN